MAIVTAVFSDATGVIKGVWFHQPYVAEQLTPGEEYILYGRVEGRTRLQFVHPEMERVDDSDDAFWHIIRD